MDNFEDLFGLADLPKWNFDDTQCPSETFIPISSSDQTASTVHPSDLLACSDPFSNDYFDNVHPQWDFHDNQGRLQETVIDGSLEQMPSIICPLDLPAHYDSYIDHSLNISGLQCGFDKSHDPSQDCLPSCSFEQPPWSILPPDPLVPNSSHVNDFRNISHPSSLTRAFTQNHIYPTAPATLTLPHSGPLLQPYQQNAAEGLVDALEPDSNILCRGQEALHFQRPQQLSALTGLPSHPHLIPQTCDSFPDWPNPSSMTFGNMHDPLELPSANTFPQNKITFQPQKIQPQPKASYVTSQQYLSAQSCNGAASGFDLPSRGIDNYSSHSRVVELDPVDADLPPESRDSQFDSFAAQSEPILPDQSIARLEPQAFAPAFDDSFQSPAIQCIKDTSSHHGGSIRKAPKRKRTQIPPATSGFTTFSIADSSSQKPKRAKFPEERRKEVAELRQRGACLRCKILKITVSHDLGSEA